MIKTVLLKQPVGYKHIIESDNVADRRKYQQALSATADRLGTKIKTSRVNGFDSDNQPRYFLVVTITESCFLKPGEE